jgi:nucleoside-diphosphate-sugar epimerase
MTTVLVTGATGFVGSHVVRDQVGRGADVHALVRPDADLHRLADLDGAYTPERADLRDTAAVTDLVRALAPDRVFHLGAAAMHAGRAPAADELVATNLGGTVTLLDACRELELQAFVLVGDAFEYGSGAGARSEETPCRPTSLDGVTKLAATLYGQAQATTSGMPVVAIRPFSIVGRDDDPKRLVPRLVETARTGSTIQLSDRRVTRDFVAVADVLDMLARAADDAERVRGRVFNCGRGEVVPLAEVVEAVERVTGRTLDAVWGAFPVAEHDLDHPVADVSAAAEALGWRPTVSLDGMIADLWAAG